MAINVGIKGSAGGDGNCTGFITASDQFTADVNGNFSFDWIARKVGCGMVQGQLKLLWKSGSGNYDYTVNTFALDSYFGYEYGWWNVTNAKGFNEFRLDWVEDGTRDYFSSQSPCNPNWQCEQPLNGYEFDGCGNRRLNAACNCNPNWQCQQPLNGLEDDGCGNTRPNAACLPLLFQVSAISHEIMQDRSVKVLVTTINAKGSFKVTVDGVETLRKLDVDPGVHESYIQGLAPGTYNICAEVI